MNRKPNYKCQECKKEIYVAPNKIQKNPLRFCSVECRKINTEKRMLENVIKCEVCDKKFYVKPSRLKRSKHICCSKECDSKLRKITYLGENNHQFGKKGQLNSSYLKTEKSLRKDGYVYIRRYSHPLSVSGWIREHRLIAEMYLMTHEQSIEINGERYLNPKLEVHHIDEDRANNDLSNLVILTKSDHKALHNKNMNLDRDELGRFIKK